MLEVILKGHDNYYGISDVLRLFYDGISEDRANNRVVCLEADDLTIMSIVDGDSVIASCDDKEIRAVAGDIPVKREVKRTLYRLLVDITSRSFPWGCLTGIRPTLVAGEVGQAEKMAQMYLVRPDKAELAVKTYMEEQRILDTVPEESLCIYIGVPFCPSRCEYCSFVSSDISHHMGLLAEYEQALIKEISLVAPAVTSKISAVYMGGGTPTVFDDESMERILYKIRDLIAMDSDTEFTVEAGRPDTITKRKLTAMRKAGVNRLCINPQTMSDETLARLNRRHTSSDTVRTYHTARETGFDMINMDLIAGLKYEPSERLLESLDAVMDLDPANITVHTLYKKRRASMDKADVLDRNGSRGDIDTVLTKAYSLLEGRGYDPYYMYRQKDTGHGLENVGFAKPGTGCRYNVAMMSDRRDVLSFGAGAMSKRTFEGGRLERCPSIKDVIGYIKSVEEVADKKKRFFDINSIE